MPKAKKEYDGPKSVGAIWNNVSGKGTKYKTMTLEHPDDPEKKIKYVIFKNENKNKDSQPDFRVLLSTPMDDKKKKKDDNEDEDDDDATPEFDEDDED